MFRKHLFPIPSRVDFVTAWTVHVGIVILKCAVEIDWRDTEFGLAA
uniref:Uncharacterized protein n=1 Tax=Anopheles quadriannulatus TaxID=34691 RepID=A0A182XSN9_ANOQN